MLKTILKSILGFEYSLFLSFLVTFPFSLLFVIAKIKILLFANFYTLFIGIYAIETEKWGYLFVPHKAIFCNLKCKRLEPFMPPYLDLKAEFPNSVPVIVNVNVTLNFGGRWSKLVQPTKIAVAVGLLIYYNGFSITVKKYGQDSNSGTTL